VSPPVLEGSIQLLPKDASGRLSAIRSGYRPGLWFGETGPTGEPHLHSAILDLVGLDELAPGEKAHVRVRPIALETWPEIEAGAPFDLFEGHRRIGTGTLAQTPASAMTEPQLRHALNEALEEWVIDQFGDRVVHRPRVAGRRQPDLIARFADSSGEQHLLVGEVLSSTPRSSDIHRLTKLMHERHALLGLIVALDPPPPFALRQLYRCGTVRVDAELSVPRIRWITTRDLALGNIDLLPRKRRPLELELAA